MFNRFYFIFFPGYVIVAIRPPKAVFGGEVQTPPEICIFKVE